MVGLVALLCVPPVQDVDWWSDVGVFCASGDVEGAIRLRRRLADLKEAESNGVIRALRAICLRISQEKDAKKYVKDLAAYHLRTGATAPAGKEGHRAALAAALSIKGEVGELLALAHIDQLLKAGEPASAFEKEAKVLKLVAVKDGLATEEGALLEQVSQIKDGGEVAKRTARSRSPGMIYCAAAALIRGLDKSRKPDARRAVEILAPLKRWSKDHVELLIKLLESFTPCASCQDVQKMTCTPCDGKGKRSLHCLECGGRGSISWDSSIPKTEKREKIDQMYGLPPGRSYCPSCINRADAKRQTKDCDFCGATGRVECQRCKWIKVDFDVVGKMADCLNCSKTGFLFERVRVPCPFCHGLGGFIQPHLDPTATVGPMN
jgi:hypothetical protein